MSIKKTGKEKTVIAFFALTLIAFIVMVVIDPHPPTDDGHDHGDLPQSVSLDQRISQARARVKSAPNNVYELINLGDLLIDNNQLMEAVSVFNNVLTIEPKNIHALTDLGTVYQKMGSYGKSYEKFKELITIDPESILAIYNLGMLNRYYKKDNEEALKYFEKLIARAGEIDPSAVQAIKNEMENIKKEMGSGAP